MIVARVLCVSGSRGIEQDILCRARFRPDPRGVDDEQGSSVTPNWY